MGARSKAMVVVASSCVLITLFLASPAQAATGDIALWEMNESGGNVVVDSSGHGLNLTRGTAVTVGLKEGTTIYHGFPWIAVNGTPSTSQRLHTISDRDVLDPGSGTFAVSLRFRTSTPGRNIFQKGQSTTAGGFWKVELGGTGQARCLFRGSRGDSYTQSAGTVTDGKWHVLTCVNSPTGSYMLIDGVKRTSTVPSGAINNSKDFVIGGKSSCDNVTVTCDFFVGDIDYVRISSVAPGSSLPTTPPVRLPTGALELVEGGAGTIRIAGTGTDPDGPHWVRLSATGPGTTVRYGVVTGGRFDLTAAAPAGTTRVCVDLIDNPTGVSAPLGCRSVVVK